MFDIEDIFSIAKPYLTVRVKWKRHTIESDNMSM